MTIGASYFVGMTVVPVFCARFIRSSVPSRESTSGNPGPPTQDLDSQPADLNRPSLTLYGRALSLALRFRWLAIAGIAVTVLASLLLLPGIGTELFPTVDAGTFERLNLEPLNLRI